MHLPIHTDVPPIREEASGALRIGNSRVLLEMVIHAFLDGATPEGIVQGYPTISLSEAYAVVAYYLNHREEVDAYLAERDRLAAEVRAKIEARQGDLSGLRERLLARRKV